MNFEKEGRFDEEMKRRQAEWERIRKPEDPVEAPDEVFDNRTLYERLKEQHDVKKKEFEDQYAFKNRIRGLDREESDFLTEVDAARAQHEKKKLAEERKELEDLKARVTRSGVTAAEVPKVTISVPKEKTSKQKELLGKVVVAAGKRKTTPPSSTSPSPNKKESGGGGSPSKKESPEKKEQPEKRKDMKKPGDVTSSDEDDDKDEPSKKRRAPRPRASVPSTHVVAGILPGIGDYASNSSSSTGDESESESDLEDPETIETNTIFSNKDDA